LKSLVLDCSVTMAWCFEDEADEYGEAVLDFLRGGKALVPPIWPFEVANVLLVAERRKRLARADAFRFLALLRALPISVDQQPGDQALNDVLALAREQKLSAYDAAYLELALRRGCALATLDERLRLAAKRTGIKVFLR